MADVNIPTWLNDLNDQIGELLSNNKVVRFSTHGNRKSFIAKLRTLVKDTVVTNIAPKTNREALQISHPNEAPSVGHTVMTPGQSQKGDQLSEQRASQTPNQRVRIW